MIIRLLTVAASICALGSACSAADAPSAQSLFGTWRVDKIVGAAPITGSDRSGHDALGSTVTISASAILESFQPNSHCRPHDMTVTEVDTQSRLEDDFSVKGTGLYLPAGSLQPRMPFLDAGCAFALVLGQDTLLWPMGNGYIYRLHREPR